MKEQQPSGNPSTATKIQKPEAFPISIGFEPSFLQNHPRLLSEEVAVDDSHSSFKNWLADVKTTGDESKKRLTWFVRRNVVSC